MYTPREIAHIAIWVKRHLLKQLSVPEAALLSNSLQESDILVDVGAHSGAWSVALSSLVPNGKVYAFEALPYYARVLRKTLKILGKNNVEVVGKPVLDESKPVHIVWRSSAGNHLTGLTHLKGKGESENDTVIIDGITLDEFFSGSQSRIRFIKMDTEGAEFLALKGAQQILRESRPLLYIELNEEYCQRYGHSVKDVIDFFSEHSYRGYQQRADASWTHIDASTYSGDGDVWFIPNEDKAFAA